MKCLFLFGWLVLLFRAAYVAYGSSQARGWIGAPASGLRHSHRNAGLSRVCGPHQSSRKCWILNPLSEAKDRTLIFVYSSRVCYHWATAGTPTASEILCGNISLTSINLNLSHCYTTLRLDMNLNAETNYKLVSYKTLLHYLEISWEWFDYNILKFYTTWLICDYVASVKNPLWLHKMNHS